MNIRQQLIEKHRLGEVRPWQDSIIKTAQRSLPAAS